MVRSVAGCIAVLALSAGAAIAADDGPTPGKALRDAEAALGTNDRDKRFATWEANLRQPLEEMEREVLADRGDELVRKYEAKLKQRDDAPTRYLLGRLLGKLDRLEGAKSEFERALVLDPAFAFAHEGLAIYQMKKGTPAEALKELERALQSQPGFHHARITLAGILFNQNDFPRAIDELTKIPTSSSDYYAARVLVGQCRLARNEPDLAIAEFQLAQKLKPDDFEASYFAADAQRRAGDLDGSIATCEAILAKKPDEYFAAFLAGRAYFDKGNLDKAKACLQVILDCDAANGAASRVDRSKVKALIERIDAAQRGETQSESLSVKQLVEDVEKNPDAKARRRAIQLLATLEAPQLLSTFAKGLQDSDYGVRVIAIREVGRLGGKDAAPLVRRFAREDPHRLVRGAACATLAEVGDRDAFGALVDALSDSETYVVDEAIRAVSKLSAKGFVCAGAEWDDAERARLVGEIRAWWAEESKRRS
jgi:tetratricopeptide (TPR) repeat protein